MIGFGYLLASMILFAAGYAAGKARGEEERKGLLWEIADLRKAVEQGGKAARGAADVLKKVRARHSGPLDRDAVRLLFGGKAEPSGPPGGGAPGPGGGVPGPGGGVDVSP